MTREEEIKKQAEKKAHEPSRLIHPYAKQYKVMSAYEIGFIEGAVWADRHPHWISVEDELPPLKQDVLIYDEDEDVIIVDARWEERNRAGWDWSSQLEPTHWMPLPQAPHHIIDANKKKVDRIIGIADHIKTALDVLNKKGGKHE